MKPRNANAKDKMDHSLQDNYA